MLQGGQCRQLQLLYSQCRWQGWDSVGSVRLPDPSPTEISRTRPCSDRRDLFDPGPVSSMSIVGRTGLSSRFTRYISGRTVCILGQSEISNIWWIEMGSASIKLILSAFPISTETPLGWTEMGNYSIELKQGDFPFHYLKSGQISDVRHKSRSVPDLSDLKLCRSRTQPEIRPTLVVSDRVGASSCAGYCRVGSVQGVLSDTTRTNPNPGRRVCSQQCSYF
jgi:hypothetical protein